MKIEKWCCKQSINGTYDLVSENKVHQVRELLEEVDAI